MMVTAQVVLESLSSAGIAVEVHRGSLRYRPASAMTPGLLAAVKSCKSELMKLLPETADASKTDIEWDRFLECAVPTPNGGLRDPGECSAELDRQIRVGGVSGEDWDSFIDDVARLGRRRD